MKPFLASLFALAAILVVTGRPALAATAEPTSSAYQWLTLIDNEKYADSWAEGSTLFRARVTEKSWESITRIFREAVGHIVWRDVDSVSLVGELPNMPRGQYAVVRYKAKFERKADCVEVVSLSQENGLWRVASYTIK
ncbi:MAG: DUF4019 domain-containing protein [Rhizomicrobium sp.]